MSETIAVLMKLVSYIHLCPYPSHTLPPPDSTVTTARQRLWRPATRAVRGGPRCCYLGAPSAFASRRGVDCWTVYPLCTCVCSPVPLAFIRHLPFSSHPPCSHLLPIYLSPARTHLRTQLWVLYEAVRAPRLAQHPRKRHHNLATTITLILPTPTHPPMVSL
jgi:hypothetical protein